MNSDHDLRHHEIVRACEARLARHGDNFLGMGWTKKKEDAKLRYQIMADVIRGNAPVTLLDIGCGASHLKEFMDAHGFGHVRYSGLDLSPAYLQLARSKFPDVVYYEADILEEAVDVPVHDYVVMNGLFTYKGSMSFDQMWSYVQKMLVRADSLCTRGFAFNVMSTCLDWQREDLFHLPFDVLARFIDANISRSFTIRHDYGLFEYTTYVYKSPVGEGA